MQRRNLPNRKSIRLKGWDYRNPGLYFVTICTKDRQHYFGEIRDGIIGLSVPGCVANYYWTEITEHFPSVELDEYIVMPNHIHGIVGIIGSDAINRVPTDQDDTTESVGPAIYGGPENDIDYNAGGTTQEHNPMLYKTHLGKIIRWYKGRCTYEIRKRNYSDFAWQSRFYDHIIRNEKALHRIRKYIYDNPLRWQTDKENIDGNEIHERAVGYMAASD